VPALKAINQYNVHSAWFDVGYGGCRFGIFSAAPPVEALHAIENGLMQRNDSCTISTFGWFG
jgi:hypothetical protein